MKKLRQPKKCKMSEIPMHPNQLMFLNWFGCTGVLSTYLWCNLTWIFKFVWCSYKTNLTVLLPSKQPFNRSVESNWVPLTNALLLCKVIIEKSRSGKFLWNRIFGLDLGRLSCLHSFKIFWPMKSSYTSNEMIQLVAHFDFLKIYEI